MRDDGMADKYVERKVRAARMLPFRRYLRVNGFTK